MKNLLLLTSLIIQYILKHISNICLSMGAILILRFVYVTHGFDSMTLVLSIMLFILAFSSEVSKEKAKIAERRNPY